MIRSTGLARLVALLLALAVHGALAVTLFPQETVKTQGAEGKAEVRLGNAFADMAAGTLSPVTAEKTLTAARPAPAETVQPARSEPASPALPLAAERAAPVTQAKAETPENTVVAKPSRPKRRSAAFEAAHTPVKPKPQAQPPVGNAERNARDGETFGQREAVGRKNDTAGQQQAEGNADADSYPGLVMRKLSRVGKPNVNTRGTAVIAFSIAANGDLSSVEIARRSGSDALDQAALRLVRKAAPFPKPPAGAQRNFSIRIKGR